MESNLIHLLLHSTYVHVLEKMNKFLLVNITNFTFPLYSYLSKCAGRLVVNRTRSYFDSH